MSELDNLIRLVVDKELAGEGLPLGEYKAKFKTLMKETLQSSLQKGVVATFNEPYEGVYSTFERGSEAGVLPVKELEYLINRRIDSL